jgi:hypothetical protein
MKIVMEEARRSIEPPLPKPPAYDPNVASALYETTDVLRNLQVKSVGTEMTADVLRTRGLTLRQTRDFEATVRPLSREGRKPPRQDLTMFWLRVERAIVGLGLKLADLSNEHIRVLAPLILGDHVYGQLASLTFFEWDDFVEAVEGRYGLSKK